MTDTRDVYPNGAMAVYESPDGEVHLDVRLEKGTVWLTVRQIGRAIRA